MWQTERFGPCPVLPILHLGYGTYISKKKKKQRVVSFHLVPVKEYFFLKELTPTCLIGRA